MKSKKNNKICKSLLKLTLKLAKLELGKFSSDRINLCKRFVTVAAFLIIFFKGCWKLHLHHFLLLSLWLLRLPVSSYFSLKREFLPVCPFPNVFSSLYGPTYCWTSVVGFEFSFCMFLLRVFGFSHMSEFSGLF